MGYNPSVRCCGALPFHTLEHRDRFADVSKTIRELMTGGLQALLACQ